MSISRDLSKFIAPSGQLEYDNTTSGLSATTIKSAIDELNTLLGGGNVGSQATFNVYEFTATASQTTFSLSSNHGQGSDITAGNFVDGTTYIITSVGTTDFVTLYGASSNTVGVTFTANTNPGTGTGTAKVVADYIPGFIKVYLNGVLLSETDYVASDGDNVVLDVGADVGALLSVVVLDSFNTATQLRVLGIDAGAPDNSVTVDASGNLDVAGTVTADGLTVETNTTSAVTISEDTGSGVAELRFIATEAFPKTKIVTDVSAASLTLETLGSDRLKIANNGDISFYEATGTTAKLFWDASAESLGIGTLTPAELLHIESGTNGEQVDIRFRGLTTSAGAGRSANIGFDPDPNDTGTSSEAQLYLSADTTNKTLVATAAGNVGIGTAPDANSKLHLLDDTSSLDDYTIHIESYTPAIVFQDISATATDFAIQVDNSALMFRYGDAATGTQLTSEAMRIEASGKVGINKINPETLLQIGNPSNRLIGEEHQIVHSTFDLFTNWQSDTAGKGAIITFSDYYNDGAFQRTTRAGIKGVTRYAGNDASGALVFYTNENASDSLFPRMTIDELGKVGIRSNTGAYADTWLHVDGDATVGTIGTTEVLRVGRPTTNAVSFDQYAAFKIGRHTAPGGGFESHTRLDIDLRDNTSTANSDTNVMTLLNNGNVGIGTPSPEALLSLSKTTAGGEGGYIYIDNPATSTLDSKSGIKFGTSAGASFASTPTGEITNVVTDAGSGASALTFGTFNGTASGERMRIDASGNLLVGRSAASDTRLHVEEVADKSESAAHFQITGSGYSAFHWLDANGYYIGQNSATRSLRLYSSAETAGAQLSAGATSFTTFSDERLKENVEPVENALQSLSGLRTVKYHLKDVDSPEDKKKIGVIAQDLVGVIDEVIDPTFRTGDDIEYMGIRYTELVPVLIKAIQEQQDLIESLTARIAALESN